MRKEVFILILIFIFLIPARILSAEYVYILNDKCINDLYLEAQGFFKATEVMPIKDSRGIILRLKIDNVLKEFYDPNISSYKQIEYFLAKIENPVIIEVHVASFSDSEVVNIKKWELSTIMANQIESIITKPLGMIEQSRVNSIGYGEFLPAKNTPNNGGKNVNRVDIIVLCNVIGE